MTNSIHWFRRFAPALPLRGTSLREDGLHEATSPYPLQQSTYLHSLIYHQELSQTTSKQSPRLVQGSGPAKTMGSTLGGSRFLPFYLLVTT